MFSASGEATLVYVPKPPPSPSTLEWFDRSGKRLERVGEASGWYNPSLSPDGKRLAVGIGDARAETGSIWILDLSRGTRARLTFGPGAAWSPVWSPDSERIAYLREDESGKLAASLPGQLQGPARRSSSRRPMLSARSAIWASRAGLPMAAP
jgi:Tol biopolymer transport system component